MSSLARTENNLDRQGFAALSTANRGAQQLRILFVHHDAADVERCLQELRSAQFAVSADVVRTPEQFVQRLRSQTYDVILAEFPSSTWQRIRALDLLQEAE